MNLQVVRDALRSLIRSERGQDVFEYVLIIGIITVAVLVAVATPVGSTLIKAVVNGTCVAINTVMEPDVVCPA